MSYLLLVLPPGLEPGLAAYETTEMTCTSLEANLVGMVGFEPTTYRLSADYSTTELHANEKLHLYNRHYKSTI